MSAPIVVKVAVEQTAYHFDKLYSYIIPDTLLPVQTGCRVLVPFGGGNRRRQAIVMEYDTTTDFKKLKPVFAVLDQEPLLTAEMLDLAQWLKERTFCTVFEAAQTMLPPGLYQKIKVIYRASPSEQPEAALTVEEQRMLLLVRERENGMAREDLLTQMGFPQDSELPERLLKKGLLIRDDAAVRMMGDATQRMIRLALTGEELETALEIAKCTEKQKKVLALLEEVGCASVKETCYFTSVTEAVVKALIKKGLLTPYENEVLRSPTEARGIPPIASASLNAEQQTAYDGLCRCLNSGKAAAALLYGVTGSGKTQVYMNLIDRVVENGKQALVMVPEISLTPQTMALFLRRYGDRVAVLHSGLSIGERMDEWKRVRRGEASIVVGTRSAVFAPLDRLGLIVMDEEQEHTYKSENSPRYHARDVARWRCARQQALLLLCSATPSVETYHHAVSGRYQMFSLPSRYGSARLPTVKVVDMREDTADVQAIGSVLQSEMADCLRTGKQVILLLNRRGYNTFVSCRSCGHVITCPSCSISMTYHSANGQLMCHYCGRTQSPVAKCPECGSDKVRYAGLGTQRVEEELNRLFPSASVLRMDADTTMSRYAYEEKFAAFGRSEYQIMIGTQMVAKGLDFPNVALVGVLSADQALYSDDFRSFETAFSLLTQVIGRAGRRDGGGTALIQTYSPDNYVIDLAARQDYPAFYQVEIAGRKAMHYPPYTDLFLLGLVGRREADVRAAAYQTLSLLRGLSETAERVPMMVLDPVPAAVAKAAGRYRYKILIKSVNNAPARRMFAALLDAYNRTPVSKYVTLFADINPVGSI